MFKLDFVASQDGMSIYSLEVGDGDNLVINDCELAQLKYLIDERFNSGLDTMFTQSFIEVLINVYNKSEVPLKATQKVLDELVKHPHLQTVREVYEGLILEFNDGRKIKVELTNGVHLR